MRQRLARITIVDLVVWGIGLAILAVAIWGVIATVTTRAATADGYAVRQADIAQASPETPAQLAVVGELGLGDIPKVRVGKGMAVRVANGARLPRGANAVVPLEDTDGASSSGQGGGSSGEVLVYKTVPRGDNMGAIYGAADWISFLIFGLAQGGVYALIALGYTMVYGVLFMINFTHGEIFMSGTYIASYVANAFQASGFMDEQPIIALLIVFGVAITVSITLAVVLERVAYRPLRTAPRLVPLITAIGASFFLQYAFARLFGSGMKRYPDVKALGGSWQIGELKILHIHAIVFLAAVLMMIGLYWFVQRTKTGKAIRAVAEDKEVAALMGIDVDRVIVTTFAVGAALAGAAGVLFALYNKQCYHTMGFIPGIKAFTAAVLGGIGNIPGAMFGGMFLGIFENIGPTLFFDGLGVPSPSQLKDVIAFTMLVVILIFRPTGIMGEVLAKKKA
ncbi:MAG: branched-chain amino acid ABC transporter permease [Anaerolineae bacterium]|nr:branched-chain amino acid ABC transporter permease [Anaerolineae bacterium]